jgi:HK97 family phage prohead protease
VKIKDLSVKIKAGPDDGLNVGQFTAYAAVFGNRDSYGDVLVPGAFDKTLAEWADSDAPIPLLWGHNMADPDYNIGEVLTAEQDDHGLLVTAQLDLDTPKAAQTYRLLKGRRVNQMSFAYDVTDGGDAVRAADDGSGSEGYFELRGVKLYEVSVVPVGANAETEILAVKAIADLRPGREYPATSEGVLREAYEALGVVLADLSSTTEDQAKASGTGPVNEQQPDGADSDEPSRNPSAKTLATLSILSLS